MVPGPRFHVFPLTTEVTTEFLRAFPEPQERIPGPALPDWVRSRRCATKSEVWRVASPLVVALREEIRRIGRRSTGNAITKCRGRENSGRRP